MGFNEEVIWKFISPFCYYKVFNQQWTSSIPLSNMSSKDTPTMHSSTFSSIWLNIPEKVKVNSSAALSTKSTWSSGWSLHLCHEKVKSNSMHISHFLPSSTIYLIWKPLLMLRDLLRLLSLKLISKRTVEEKPQRSKLIRSEKCWLSRLWILFSSITSKSSIIWLSCAVNSPIFKNRSSIYLDF